MRAGMALITLLAGSLIGVVFAVGAIAKVVRFGEWKLALEAYRLPRAARAAASVAVPVAESAVVALLVLDQARAGAALTLALLAIFSSGLLYARREHGDRLPCGCFGRAVPHDYRLLAARNAGLAILAGIVLVNDHDRLLNHVTMPGPSALLPAALVIVGLSLAVWVARELSQAARRQ
jgi:hypothetical protein